MFKYFSMRRPEVNLYFIACLAFPSFSSLCLVSTCTTHSLGYFFPESSVLTFSGEPGAGRRSYLGSSNNSNAEVEFIKERMTEEPNQDFEVEGTMISRWDE